MMDANPLPAAAPFVGREREIGLLRRRLDEAVHGAGGIVLIAGEPGIGKTRLAEQLSVEAQARGVQVLWGRCYEGEGAPSFWPWVQIIRSYVRDHDADRLREQMGPGAADIAQVVPEVRERLPDLDPPPPLEPAQARFRFFDSVATFLAAAARAQPLLLVLDDLHWSDGPSLLLLQFLARELRSLPLLVVGSYRDAEIDRDHPLTATLAELARAPSTERLHLSGLTDADVARFIELSDDTPFPSGLIQTIAHETEGNPFFVTQVVRLFSGEGWLDRPDQPATWSLVVPQSVREVLSRRLDRLSPACHRALSVAALLGREFRLATLERAGELAGAPPLDAIEEATRARVVQPLVGAPGTYSFTHALMRETLYDELGAAARVRLHSRAGEALETLYAADPEPYFAELAYHFTQAALGGGADKAVDYARRAGDRALSLLAFEDAAAHYGRALETLRLKEPPDQPAAFELLLAMGNAWSRAGQTQRAQDACLGAAGRARRARLRHRPTCRRARLPGSGRAAAGGAVASRQEQQRASRTTPGPAWRRSSSGRDHTCAGTSSAARRSRWRETWATAKPWRAPCLRDFGRSVGQTPSTSALRSRANWFPSRKALGTGNYSCEPCTAPSPTCSSSATWPRSGRNSTGMRDSPKI